MLKEKAYAKINLFLNVIGKRPDGYHDLEMVMAPLDFYDVLSFEPLKTNEIKIDSNVQITDDPKDNLVYKIAKKLQDDFSIETGVNIYIKKNIPMAAGLAGGSADAAATLRGLNKLWKLKLSLKDMAKIGEKFGSDIPFCVYNKLAVARGKGEDLLFLNQKLNMPVLLVNPNVKVSTPEVFKRLKETQIKHRKISDMTSGIYNRNQELIERELFNSLEEVAFEIEPKIKEIKEQIKEMDIPGVLMSGSGATVFAISKDTKKLKNAEEVFNDLYFKILTKIK